MTRDDRNGSDMGTAHLIGIEGTFELGDVLTWGAGAVGRQGDTVHNSISGLSTSMVRLNELANNGAVTLLPKPITVREDFTGWVVLMADLVPSVFKVLPQDGAMKSDTHEGLEVVLFSRDAFEVYRNRVASELTQTFMNGSRDKELAELAMVLCPSHPAILAIYSALHYPQDRQHLLRARCKLPETQDLFDTTLKKMQQ